MQSELFTDPSDARDQIIPLNCLRNSFSSIILLPVFHAYLQLVGID